MAEARPVELQLGPWRGFVSTRQRHALKSDELGPDSQEWSIDPIDGRLIRRGGSSILHDTLSGANEVTGILESKWSSRALQIGELRSLSWSSGSPGYGILYGEESAKAGTLAWWSPARSVYWQLLREFGATHYLVSSSAGEVHMKIPPLWAEGMSGNYIRGINATQRKFETAGSRRYIDVSGVTYLPNRYGTPSCWNQLTNDSTSAGTEKLRRFPWGLPPPLFAPSLSSVGTDLGTTVKGPYKDGDTFFVTTAFEFADGSVGPAYAINPGQTTPSRAGTITVGTRGGGHYYSSITIKDIAIGPRMPIQCVARRVYVSKIVNLAASEKPYGISEFQLYAVARIANNSSVSLVMTGGEQTALTADVDLRFDHRWPPQAQFAVPVDGRAILGGAMRQNPLAIIIAPTGMNSSRQQNVDDENTTALYGTIWNHVRIDGTNLTLKKSTGAATTKLDIALSGKTLNDVVAAINETLYTDTEGEWAAQLVPGVDGSILASNLARTDSTDFGDDSNLIIYDGTTGNARCHCPNYPFYAAFSAAYMASQPVDYYGTIMSSAGPGKPDGSFSTFYSRPDNFKGANNHAGGRLQMVVPITGNSGVVAVYYYERATYVLRNVRGGGTGEDGDYRLVPLDLLHGTVSFLTCGGGFGVAHSVTSDGLRLTDGQTMILISEDLLHYSKAGLIGEWAIEIPASAYLTAQGSLPYMTAQILGTLIRVRYRTNSGNTYCDSGVDYDFSQGHDIGGLATFLRQDENGQRGLYGWSCPVRAQKVGVLGRFVDSTGYHNIGAQDTNAGTGDGRVDELDQAATTNSKDNLVAFTSKGYSPTLLPDPFMEWGALMADPLWAKNGTGLTINLYVDPDRTISPSPLTLASSSSNLLGRAVFRFPQAAMRGRQSLEFLVQDDGSSNVLAEVRSIPVRAKQMEAVGRFAP